MSSTIAHKVCAFSIALLPVLSGAMYAASYNLNTSHNQLSTEDASMYLRVMLFGYFQFLAGYATGLVIMTVRAKLCEMENLPYVEMKDSLSIDPT
jgi:hypothetical protein